MRLNPRGLRVITDERSSLGEQAKKIEYLFCEAIPHKARRMARRVYRGATSDYAPAAARSDNPEVMGERSEALAVREEARRASEKIRSIATNVARRLYFRLGNEKSIPTTK